MGRSSVFDVALWLSIHPPGGTVEAVGAGPVGEPHAVLLDLDGTLVRSEHVHRRVWQRFFDAWRLEVDEAGYARAYQGRRAADVLVSEPGPWRPEDVPGVLADMHAWTDELAGEVEPVPGAVDLVGELHRRAARVAVVTSAGRPWAGRLLGDVLGVAVEVLVTAEDVRVGKPSPEGYLLACRRCGVDPGECAAVEDSPSGIRALGAAGVGRVVGVTTTSPAADLRAAGAHVTVPDLRPPGSLAALGVPVT
jgi:sugar-phosphatase